MMDDLDERASGIIDEDAFQELVMKAFI